MSKPVGYVSGGGEGIIELLNELFGFQVQETVRMLRGCRPDHRAIVIIHLINADSVNNLFRGW